MLFVECIALYRVRVMEVVFRCIRPAGFDQYPLPPLFPISSSIIRNKKKPRQGVILGRGVILSGARSGD